MGEPTVYMFSHTEVVTALIRKQGLHEGRWALAIQFGLGAVNVGQSGENNDLNPSAIIGILGIGLRAEPAVSNLSVDAAEVNPVKVTAKVAKPAGKKARN